MALDKSLFLTLAGYYRYQEELSHFPQKSAFQGTGSVIWRFEVPGRTVCMDIHK
jgi:hypothetical protein